MITLPNQQCRLCKITIWPDEAEPKWIFDDFEPVHEICLEKATHYAIHELLSNLGG